MNNAGIWWSYDTRVPSSSSLFLSVKPVLVGKLSISWILARPLNGRSTSMPISGDNIDSSSYPLFLRFLGKHWN